MSSSSDSKARAADDHVKLPPRAGWFRRQFSDILYVAKRDKKWWLLPLLFALLLMAALLLTATALGPLAPFVYPFL